MLDISTRFVIKDEAGSEILKIENKRICECCEDVDFNVRKALKVATHCPHFDIFLATVYQGWTGKLFFSRGGEGQG